MEDNRYGLGENPPYSLYQAENGKWGLIDGSGKKLEAVFDRVDMRFSCEPWEVVTFDEKEGFELLAWYDPSEVWFNFTFDDPLYPEEFATHLWKCSKKKIDEYADTLYNLTPSENHWLIDYILNNPDNLNFEDEGTKQIFDDLLCKHPELNVPANTNVLLDPVMRNDKIDEDIKRVLWQEKVSFDYGIKRYLRKDSEYDD